MRPSTLACISPDPRYRSHLLRARESRERRGVARRPSYRHKPNAVITYVSPGTSERINLARRVRLPNTTDVYMHRIRAQACARVRRRRARRRTRRREDQSDPTSVRLPRFRRRDSRTDRSSNMILAGVNPARPLPPPLPPRHPFAPALRPNISRSSM